MRHYTSSFAAGLALVLTFAALNTNVLARPEQQQAPAKTEEPLCPPLSKDALSLLNNNGIIDVCPDFDLARPKDATQILDATPKDGAPGLAKYVFLNANNGTIYEADVFRSSTRNRIEKIKFTKPAANGAPAQTAEVEVESTIYHGKPSEIKILGFDGKRQKIEFEYKTFSRKLEKIEVEREGGSETKLEIDYHTFSGGLEKIKLDGKVLPSV